MDSERLTEKKLEFGAGQYEYIVHFHITKKSGSLLDDLFVIMSYKNTKDGFMNQYEGSMKIFSNTEGLNKLTHIVDCKETADMGFVVSFEYSGGIMQIVLKQTKASEIEKKKRQIKEHQPIEKVEITSPIKEEPKKGLVEAKVETIMNNFDALQEQWAKKIAETNCKEKELETEISECRKIREINEKLLKEKEDNWEDEKRQKVWREQMEDEVKKLNERNIQNEKKANEEKDKMAKEIEILRDLLQSKKKKSSSSSSSENEGEFENLKQRVEELEEKRSFKKDVEELKNKIEELENKMNGSLLTIEKITEFTIEKDSLKEQLKEISNETKKNEEEIKEMKQTQENKIMENKGVEDQKENIELNEIKKENVLLKHKLEELENEIKSLKENQKQESEQKEQINQNIEIIQHEFNKKIDEITKKNEEIQLKEEIELMKQENKEIKEKVKEINVEIKEKDENKEELIKNYLKEIQIIDEEKEHHLRGTIPRSITLSNEVIEICQMIQEEDKEKRCIVICKDSTEGTEINVIIAEEEFKGIYYNQIKKVPLGVLSQIIENSTLIRDNNKVILFYQNQQIELQLNNQIELWPRIVRIYHFIANGFNEYFENSVEIKEEMKESVELKLINDVSNEIKEEIKEEVKEEKSVSIEDDVEICNLNEEKPIIKEQNESNKSSSSTSSKSSSSIKDNSDLIKEIIDEVKSIPAGIKVIKKPKSVFVHSSLPTQYHSRRIQQLGKKIPHYRFTDFWNGYGSCMVPDKVVLYYIYEREDSDYLSDLEAIKTVYPKVPVFTVILYFPEYCLTPPKSNEESNVFVINIISNLLEDGGMMLQFINALSKDD